jgi:glycosyltransferase involved in cell wall biosynthesis
MSGMTVADSDPEVSVVMSVYNGGDQLAPTIDSVLRQSFESFEFVIVNDGSTDQSVESLLRYADRDPRIVVIDQQNTGLTRALIRGTERARGEFIARQDVGDRSLPTRLEKQVEFLRSRPDVVAVGAGSRRIGPCGEWLGDTVRKLTPEEVTLAFKHQGVGLPHTVAMFRREAFEAVGGYRPEFRFAQDYDLWHRLIDCGLLAELPDVLFEWGIDTGGISSASHDRQRRLAELAKLSYERRSRGQDDSDILQQAKQISWDPLPNELRISQRLALAGAEFFIGSQLFAVGDRRCRHYLWRAVRQRPWWLRPWAKLLLSFAKPQR